MTQKEIMDRVNEVLEKHAYRYNINRFEDDGLVEYTVTLTVNYGGNRRMTRLLVFSEITSVQTDTEHLTLVNADIQAVSYQKYCMSDYLLLMVDTNEIMLRI